MAAGRVTWDEFAGEAPELADLGRKRLEDRGLCLIGTIRTDGTPRISPVELLIFEGRLYLGMMWQVAQSPRPDPRPAHPRTQLRCQQRRD